MFNHNYEVAQASWESAMFDPFRDEDSYERYIKNEEKKEEMSMKYDEWLDFCENINTHQAENNY